MSKQVTTIGQVIDTQVKNVLAVNAHSFETAFVISTAIQEIDKALTPAVMEPIMALQGKKLGFRTDKIYPVTTVKECLIEACLSGVQVTGNQFNIIAGNMYITKEGYGHLLLQIPGLRYTVSHSILEEKNGYTDVSCKITWKIGENESKKQVEIFPVKSGKYGTPDNILGKAERKARKWLYEHLSGRDTDDGAIDISHTEVKTEMEIGRNANKEEISFDDQENERILHEQLQKEAEEQSRINGPQF